MPEVDVDERSERRLKEIRGRLEGITRPPWKASDGLGCKQIRGAKAGTHRQAQYRTEVCWTPGLHDEDEDRANADLIANAPSDLRFLLRENRRLRTALDADTGGRGD